MFRSSVPEKDIEKRGWTLVWIQLLSYIKISKKNVVTFEFQMHSILASRIPISVFV